MRGASAGIGNTSPKEALIPSPRLGIVSLKVSNWRGRPPPSIGLPILAALNAAASVAGRIPIGGLAGRLRQVPSMYAYFTRMHAQERETGHLRPRQNHKLAE